MKAAALVLALAACSEVTGGDEIKLGRRSRDAGPAVIIVDRNLVSSLQAIDEREPNDAPDGKGGQPLAAPGAVRGRIDAPGDRDLYRIALPVAGTLKVTLSGVEDADLVVEVRQPGGQLVAVSDNGAAKVDEGFPNLFVQPGPLVVVVREAVRAPPKGKPRARKGTPPPSPPPSRPGPSQPYLLEVRLLPPPAPGEEREPNGESAFADQLALGAIGRGLIGWRRDSDTWRVALDGIRDDEALSVDVEGVEGVALKLSLVDGAGQPILERKGKTGAPVSLRSVAIPESSTMIFVVVTGDRANDSESYTVRASAAALVLDEETEPNDTPATASPLADVPGAASGTRVGTLAAGDIDCFHLESAEVPRHLQLRFSPPPSADGVLSVVSDDGAVLAAPVDLGKKGGEEKLTGVAVPAGRAAIVTLAGKSGEASERYQLRWNVVEAAPAAVPGIDE